jgi:hypothetical protein
VDNEFDLWQCHGCGAEVPKGKSRLALLIPYTYIKPDFARPSGPNDNYKEPVVAFQDARAIDEKENSDANIAKSLSRRFILWRFNKGVDAIPPGFSAGDVLSDDKWMYAVVLGNQTWVTAELPVTVNGGAPTWVVVGTTWGDLLQTCTSGLYAVESASTECSPVLRIRRACAPKDGPMACHNSNEYRFWFLPEASFNSTEVYPGDSLIYTP